jgi:hypothetical protein
MIRRFIVSVFFLALFRLAFSQAPEAPAKPLPPGPMQAKVKAACTQCHNVGRITEKHLSRMQWSDELDKMAGLGASVPDPDRKDFLDYLTKNFGPQKPAPRAMPRSNGSQ